MTCTTVSSTYLHRSDNKPAYRTLVKSKRTDVRHDVPCDCDIEGLPTQAEALVSYCVRKVLPKLRKLDVAVSLCNDMC